jgi:uncharacterized membrane protein
MPMTDTRRAFLQIHCCVLLWGFTAILGKLITLSALPLVWWRMLIVVASLALVPGVWRGLRGMSRKLLLAYGGIGVLVSLHWLTFYGAIKLSNASVGATCMALATVFTALIEPRWRVDAFRGASSRSASPSCPAWRWSSAACRTACGWASWWGRFPRCSLRCSARSTSGWSNTPIR